MVLVIILSVVKMKMISVYSSAISAIGYDPITQKMNIQFRNSGTYTFCRVPSYIFESFFSANSKGKYHDQYIRDHYHC